MSPLAFLAFILLAVALGLLLSASALMLEEMAFHQYPRAKHSALLWGAMLFENLGYRQLNTLWRIEGTWKWFRGRPQVWGEMTRKGLRA
jgi:hypothetical protein